MQTPCQVCSKPVNYERGAVEVACPYCYTEYRIDGMGRLRQVDLFDDDEPLAVDDEPRAGGGPAAPDRSDMKRLLDDGEGQHITFIKEADEVRRSKPGAAVPAGVQPPSPGADIGSLEFADDEDDDGGRRGRGARKPGGPTFADLTGGGGTAKAQAKAKAKANQKGAAKQQAAPARPTPALGREDDRSARPAQRKKKPRTGGGERVGHPDAFAVPDDMPQEVDNQQRALVSLVIVLVGVMIVGGLLAGSVIMLSGSGSSDDDRVRHADGDGGDDGTDDSEAGPTDGANDANESNESSSSSGAADGSGLGLNEVVAKAEQLLDAGTAADAHEAVVWLETAAASGELNTGQRRRIEHTLEMARQACDAWRLYEQGVAAIERAEAVVEAEPLRANFERHFALDMLREASSATRRGIGFTALREKITAATTRAQGE